MEAKWIPNGAQIESKWSPKEVKREGGELGCKKTIFEWISRVRLGSILRPQIDKKWIQKSIEKWTPKEEEKEHTGLQKGAKMESKGRPKPETNLS